MKSWKSLFATFMLLGVLVAPISFVLPVSAQGEVTLNPTDDTFVKDITAVGNFGNSSILEVGKYEDPYPGPWESIAWLKFNLSSVPDGAVVDVATLQLYSYAVHAGMHVYAHFCSNNSWTELTLTYANMPDFNATSMDSEVVATSSKWYYWTVTDAVQQSVDGIFGGPGIVTIVLLETSLHGLDLTVSFYSKEGAILYMPELSIHWTYIIPEFPSFLILPLLMIATLLAVIVRRRKQST